MSQAAWYNDWIMKKFAKYLQGDILEVGCGIGNFTQSLNNFGNVWAMDIKEEYVTTIKKEVCGKVQVGIGDIEKGNYFFGNQKFDSIVCLNVLEHIKEDDQALNNLFKLLKNGGKLILIVPSHQFLYGKIDRSIGHFRRYDRANLNNLMTHTGFKIINERILNMLGGIGWWFSSKLFRKIIVESGQIRLFNLFAPFILPLEDIIEPPFGTSILVIAKR